MTEQTWQIVLSFPAPPLDDGESWQAGWQRASPAETS
jgi:hypothetical protein